MNWFVSALAAVVLALATLSVPGSIFTTEASASRMNGKGGWCSSGMNCMQDRYYAAKARGAKSKKHR